MGNLTTALVIVMGINVILWLGQVAMLNINPEGPLNFHCEGSLLGTFDKNNCAYNTTPILDETDPGAKFPSSTASVSVETGNIFTDIYSAVKNFILKDLGLEYIFMILSAPSTFLKAIGAPSEVSFALGAMWYSITFFLIIAWWKGGDA